MTRKKRINADTVGIRGISGRHENRRKKKTKKKKKKRLTSDQGHADDVVRRTAVGHCQQSASLSCAVSVLHAGGSTVP